MLFLIAMTPEQRAEAVKRMAKLPLPGILSALESVVSSKLTPMNTPTQNTEHTPDLIRVRAANLVSMAVARSHDKTSREPFILQQAADMLTDLLTDNQRLREQVAQLTEAMEQSRDDLFAADTMMRLCRDALRAVADEIEQQGEHERTYDIGRTVRNALRGYDALSAVERGK